MHRRGLCLLLLVVTIVTGLLWRMAPLHLSIFLFKYGGSALWAIAVYWLLAGMLPKLTPTTLGLLAGLIAALTELSRLWHTLATDHFRATLAGRLLLGRFFSLKNIAAYWLAILCIASLDHLFNARSSSPQRAA